MKKYKYLISVIIPIYNVEEYIEDAIKSIISQSIGFDNIELILINDGSPANEKRICEKYANKYKNIRYIEQKNQGVSVARNNGINIAKGKYLNFLDSDDKFEKNALEIGYNMLENNPNINLVGFRQKFFEAAKGYHAMDYRFKEEDRIVDITKEYDCLQLSAAASLIRKDAIDKYNIRFDEKIKLSEDAKFMTDILLKNKEKEYGLVSSANYLYRRRKIRNSKIQTSSQDISSYSFTSKHVYEYVFNLSKEQFGKVIPYAQYFVMYHLQYKLITGIATNLEKDEEKKHKDYLLKLIDEIDDNIILEQKNISIIDKIYILNIKHKKDIQKDIILKNDCINYKKRKYNLTEKDYLIGLNHIEEQNDKINYEFNIPEFLTDKIEIKINKKTKKFKLDNSTYSNYELFNQYTPKMKKIIIEIKKKGNTNVEFNYSNYKTLIKGNGYLELFNSKYAQYKIHKYNTSIKKNKLIIKKRSISTLINKLNYYLLLLFKNRNAFILSILFSITKPFYKNKKENLIYVNNNNEKEILKYFKENNIDLSNYIIIKNNKFSRSIKFKLQYLNLKNIYYMINDVIINPFGKSYKEYLNKTHTNHIIFTNKNTTENEKELHKYKNKKTCFIEIQ